MSSEKEEREEEDKKPPQLELEWKDYVAITIALLETVLSPFVILIIVLAVLAIIISIIW